MVGIHFLDILAIVAYLGVVLYLGKKASHGAADSEEGFFLAGRKLGKAYQFFLNFGNATDANGAVSTASLVYQKGASGVWLSLQTLFMNPYYWFMNLWFRRVRLVTVADLFDDRFGSRALARFYAIFQIFATVIVIIGFGNLVSYKVTSSLMVKPEESWTVEERAAVEGYQEFKALEAEVVAGTITPEETVRLEFLAEQNKRGELRNYVSYLHGPVGKWGYYLIYTAIVGTYIVMGGLAAAAINEAFQGILIVIFSFMLIPFGLTAIGGWSALAEKVPEANFMLLSGTGIGAFELFGIFLISIIQIHGIIGNMGVAGSAKSEYAARFGAVSGTYAKRVMIILWAFCGLIAIALYNGAASLSDPDSAWGTMALQLLKPGLLGLMMAGLLAANMSTIASQTVAVSALFTRNVFKYLFPNADNQATVLAGRLSIVVILLVGVVAAANMDNVYGAIQLLLTVNVPFGAAVLLIFFWRKLTVGAVWWAVGLSAILNIIFPSWIGPNIDAISHNENLTVEVAPSGGLPSAVYFDTVIHEDPNDTTSPKVGTKRFHTEIYILSKLGVDVESYELTTRNALRYVFDGVFPFLVLIIASFLTRKPNQEKVDQFMGKMKTPVAETPELDLVAMEETRRNPHRFDHNKLLGPESQWEFKKWNRVDAVGFIVCLATSFGILACFWILLRAAAG